MNLLNKILSKIKGEDFRIDENIPLSYLFLFFTNKILNFMWGMIVLKKMFVFISPSSKIKCRNKIRGGKNLNIDRNCYIDALSIEGITLGDNCSIGKNTTIECSGTLKNIGKGLIVGDRVGLGTHGFFGCAGGVKIGDDTIFGNYVSLHSENHNFNLPDLPIRLQGVNRKGIIIGKNCWIGAKATILDGTNIGDGCIIAAGAVVRGEILPNSIVGGVPAKVIKSRDNSN